MGPWSQFFVDTLRTATVDDAENLSGETLRLSNDNAAEYLSANEVVADLGPGELFVRPQLQFFRVLKSFVSPNFNPTETRSHVA